MLDFDLTEEQRLLEQSVREWAGREIAPRIRELDRQHRFDYFAARDGGVRSGTFQMRREEFSDRRGQTIARQYVLPAIQREFVWRPEQVCQLFDSLLRGYPIGAFLFWNVAEERSREFVF